MREAPTNGNLKLFQRYADTKWRLVFIVLFMCVCVCVCERERDSEISKGNHELTTARITHDKAHQIHIYSFKKIIFSIWSDFEQKFWLGIGSPNARGSMSHGCSLVLLFLPFLLFSFHLIKFSIVNKTIFPRSEWAPNIYIYFPWEWRADQKKEI